MTKFFEELKRRNVYKVAVAYLVTSWLVMQVVSVLSTPMEWGPQEQQVVLRFLVVGFPIILVLAWLYELTPKGWRLTGKNQGDTVSNDKAGRRLNYFIIATLALTLTTVLYERFFIAEQKIQAASGRQVASIAILPFESLSPNEDDRYFAVGISTEIKDDLRQVSGMRVVGDISVQNFLANQADYKTIRSSLKASHLLGGKVTKLNNRVRIYAELLDTATEEIVWSNHYEQDIDTYFELQKEISRQIISSLSVELVPEERLAIQRMGTQDTLAFKYYQEALELKRTRNSANMDRAIDLLLKAVERDSQYAAAYAHLAMAYHFKQTLENKERKVVMEYYLGKALDLNPELGEAILAKGILVEYREADEGPEEIKRWEEQLSLFNRAADRMPNDPITHNWRYVVNQNLGRSEAAFSALSAAYELDPLNPPIAMNRAKVHEYKGELEEARVIYTNLTTYIPSFIGGYIGLSDHYMYEHPGDISGKLKFFYPYYRNNPNDLNVLLKLEKIFLYLDLLPLAEQLHNRVKFNTSMSGSYYVHLYQKELEINILKGDYAKAHAVLDGSTSENDPDDITFPAGKRDRSWVYFHEGKIEKAITTLESVYPELPEKLFDWEVVEAQEIWYDWYQYPFVLKLYATCQKRKGNMDLASFYAQRWCEDERDYLRRDDSREERASLNSSPIEARKTRIDFLMADGFCQAYSGASGPATALLEEAHFDLGLIGQTDIPIRLDAGYDWIVDDPAYKDFFR